MSALPAPEPPPRNPYRLTADQGPRTRAEIRAALAAHSPADLVLFDARLDAARVGELPDIYAEARHVVALRSRPEVDAAITASLSGETEGDLVPWHEYAAILAVGEEGGRPR
ncbi:hypothetical protein ACIQU6_30775 [Streptomyces sp. NPDC090442]|uniref:hypothetical protein n=1 Tax=Streptomyces sp. NPDC090442 TaxID=3365962 RepID=UPI0037F66810